MSFRLFLDPADNFLIRDGRPFNQSDAGQARATSRFPPPPDTLYGTARVAMALSMGWNGSGDWEKEITDVLGSYSTETGGEIKFQVAGPFFMLDGNLLAPIPFNAFLAGPAGQEEIKIASPGSALNSDYGSISYPEIPLDAKPLGGRWAPETAVRELLNGNPITQADLGTTRPTSFRFGVSGESRKPGLGSDELGPIEARIGLARDLDTHLATDGMLYASNRRTLASGVRMFVIVTGVDLGKSGLPSALPFGGEALLAKWLGHSDVAAAFKKIEAMDRFAYRAEALRAVPYLLAIKQLAQALAAPEEGEHGK